ncbi:MAG: polyhydroxyalkanoate synthesis regulator DNA-binding domain-containing protein [Ardenticatenaceae bacterium]|nr:polyhydroxyalkanoate synthesis regulator DNA-binding domain-containing protein [Ardenticatenaceae bacterium]
MLIIKRYPNRKLYDTEAKKYITLDGIAELIRTGTEVQVLDHTSNEDLTAVVLTQIIFEQEKKSSGFLPRSVLKGLVQAGGDTLSSLRRTLASPLELFRHVDDEIRRRIEALIKQGELTLEDGQEVLEKLLDQGKQAFTEAATLRTDELSQRLAELGVPTRNEIEELTAQLESLEAALDRIAPESQSK